MDVSTGTESIVLKCEASDNIDANGNLTTEQAMTALKIPEAERQKYISWLEEQSKRGKPEYRNSSFPLLFCFIMALHFILLNMPEIHHLLE